MNTLTWSNFTGFPDQSILNQNFADTQVKSSEEQKATYEKVAHACEKPWYSPIFSNDEKPAIVSSGIGVVVGAVEVVPVELKENKLDSKPDAKPLTIPPIKIEQNDLLNAVLIGLGVVFVFKILQ